MPVASCFPISIHFAGRVARPLRKRGMMLSGTAGKGCSVENQDFEQMLGQLAKQGLPAGSEMFRDTLLKRCLAVLDADEEGTCIDDADLDMIAAAGNAGMWPNRNMPGTEHLSH